MLLQAHCGKQGGKIRARKDPPRAGGPGRVNRLAPLVKQHPEARDGLPERARGDTHLGEVFCGEGDRDHGRATFK